MPHSFGRSIGRSANREATEELKEHDERDNPGWQLGAHCLYPGVVCVSGQYCSHDWSKLLTVLLKGNYRVGRAGLNRPLRSISHRVLVLANVRRECIPKTRGRFR